MEAMKLMTLFMHGCFRGGILCQDVCGAFMYRLDDKVALSHDLDALTAQQFVNVLKLWRLLDNSES